MRMNSTEAQNRRSISCFYTCWVVPAAIFCDRSRASVQSHPHLSLDEVAVETWHPKGSKSLTLSETDVRFVHHMLIFINHITPDVLDTHSRNSSQCSPSASIFLPVSCLSVSFEGRHFPTDYPAYRVGYRPLAYLLYHVLLHPPSSI